MFATNPAIAIKVPIIAHMVMLPLMIMGMAGNVVQGKAVWASTYRLILTGRNQGYRSQY
jgi:hypothetical protein